jgi:hypothetical protein
LNAAPAALLALWALVATPGWASEDPPQWRWEAGEARRYLLQSTVTWPEGVSLLGADAIARLVRWRLGLVVSCVPTRRATARVHHLRCDVEQAALAGNPATPADALGDVLGSNAAALREGALVLIQRDDGRLRRVVARLPGGRDRRGRIARETLEALVLRAAAAMDLQLPTSPGALDGLGWVQQRPQAYGLPRRDGATVFGQLAHEAPQADAEVWAMRLRGEAQLAAGRVQLEGSTAAWRAALTGTWRFDAAAGALLESQFVLRATPAAVDFLREGPDPVYEHAALAVWLRDEAPAVLGPDGLLE